MAATTVVAPDAPSDARAAASGRGGRRRWPRRLLIGINIVLAVSLVSAGALYGYVSYRFGQIKRVAVPGLSRGAGTTPVGAPVDDSPGSPVTILVVGSDSRANLSPADVQAFGDVAQSKGARSDTTMLVHLDPVARTASLLSIPRDLWVPIGASGVKNRINTAFDVGPDVLVRTIQDDLGIPINHYVAVDFTGFRKVVNALGGVRFWYPEPVHDTFSGLNITTPGCYTLTGDMALALVRARHMTYQDNGRWRNELASDLARIRRQQLFVQRVVTKAQGSGLGDVNALNGAVAGVVGNLTVDTGFSQTEIVRLAKRYRSFDPGRLTTMTLPTAPAVIHASDGDADVLLPVPDQDRLTIDAFLGTASGQGGSGVTTPAAPVPPMAPSTVAVSVLNGSGRTGEATAVTRDLRGLGFAASVSGNGSAASFDHTATEIRYAPGAEAKARFLQETLTGGATLVPDAGLASGPLVLTTGTSYGGVHPPSAAPVPGVTPTPPPAIPATASPEPAFPGSHGADPPPPGSGC